MCCYGPASSASFAHSHAVVIALIFLMCCAQVFLSHVGHGKDQSPEALTEQVRAYVIMVITIMSHLQYQYCCCCSVRTYVQVDVVLSMYSQPLKLARQVDCAV